MENKKEKGKIRKWVDDHTVELTVYGGAILIGAVTAGIGYTVGVTSHKFKVMRNIHDVIDDVGAIGSNSTLKTIEDNFPEAMTVMNNTHIPETVIDFRENFYKEMNTLDMADYIAEKLL